MHDEFRQETLYPVNHPGHPGWLESLLDLLREYGFTLEGDLTPARQATERYFQILA